METTDYYVVYADGACEPTNPKGNMGIGVIIFDKERKTVFELSKYIPAKDLNYATSNNVAEYMGIIEAMNFFIKNNLQKEKIICCGDSKLWINQLGGTWGCNGGIYTKYYYEAKELVKQFSNIKFEWIPREKNYIADELSKRGMIAAGCQFKIQPIK